MYIRVDEKENQRMTHDIIMAVFQVVFSDPKSLDSKKLTLKKLKPRQFKTMKSISRHTV
jgi:hypothetical protein